MHYTVSCVKNILMHMVIVPALLGIVIIIKNKELQANNTIYLINLLLAIVGVTVCIVQLYIYGLLIVLYFLGVNIDIDCRLKMIPRMILVIANKLMHVHSYVCVWIDSFTLHFHFPTNGS